MLMSLSIHLHGLHLDTQYGHVSIRVSVCLSQAAIVLKRLNGLNWFLAHMLLLTYPMLCFKEI